MEESRIALLRERSRHCVCRYCGNKLHLKRILFNEIEEAQVELYCEYCQRIEFGVEQDVYACAENYVNDNQFNYYGDLDDTEQVRRMNIAKICEILTEADYQRGFCNDTGFQVPVQYKRQKQNGISIYRAKELM